MFLWIREKLVSLGSVGAMNREQIRLKPSFSRACEKVGGS